LAQAAQGIAVPMVLAAQQAAAAVIQKLQIFL
jgi:hypothetical protein